MSNKNTGALSGAGLNSLRYQTTFGTVGAIAEIVDNSIQWKQEKKDVDINIIFIERDGVVDEVLISDNGVGMGTVNGSEIIDMCLMFGGGTNHGAKANLGKYGVGLPSACCSQSTDYHVYSWEKKGKIKHKYRNHNDFFQFDTKKGILIKDEPVNDKTFTIENSFPKYFEDYIPDLKDYNSGTIVQWKSCDELSYKRAETLINHIELKLGRIYRHFIGNGVNINFRTYSQPKNSSPIRQQDLCKAIRKFDVTFLSKGNNVPAPFDKQATSEQFGALYTHKFTDSSGQLHEFKILATLAKKEIQLPNCQAGGRIGPGPRYKEAQGISLVRAKREIKLGTFGYEMNNGASDTRHRWWKIEVQFEPISDRLLGVNSNKTHAEHFKFISDVNAVGIHSVDYMKLRYELASKIRNFMDLMWDELMLRVQQCKESKVKKREQCPKCKNYTLKPNGECADPNCGNIVTSCKIHGQSLPCTSCQNLIVSARICPRHKLPFESNGKCKKCEATPALSKDEIEEIVEILKPYWNFKENPEDLNSLIEWFVKSGKKHFVLFVNKSNDLDFFEPIIIPGKFILILINVKHPYYLSQIEPLRNIDLSDQDVIDNLSKLGFTQDPSEMLESIMLFIITWSEVEVNSTSDNKVIGRFRNRFGTELEELLSKWLN
jgi:hypothetical protein